MNLYLLTIVQEQFRTLGIGILPLETLRGKSGRKNAPRHRSPKHVF